MAKKDLTYSDSAGSAVGKINDNFGELATGTSVTPAIVTKDVKASSFCTAVNNVMTALRTAFGMSSSLHPIADTNTAKQVVDNINTDMTNLYAAQSSGGGETPTTPEKLKVLFLGNSYTSNSVFYLPFILQNLGIDIDFKISFFFAAGASIDDYYSWWSSTQVKLYTFDSETDTAWSNEMKKPSMAVQSDDWNLIVFQQASAECFTLSTYSHVPDLLNMVATAMSGRTYKVGWNINHTQNTMDCNYPLQMLSVVQSVCQSNGISVILPYGTAIFNALTKASCRSYGGGLNRNFKHSDNKHLAPGLPMYVASLAIAQALSNEFNLGLSIQDDTTTPTVDWSTEGNANYKGISPVYTNTNFLSVTDEYRAIAKAAVAAAISSPFTVTQLDNETLSVTYNLTHCHIVGTAPTTIANYGQGISFRVVADEGYTIMYSKVVNGATVNLENTIVWKRNWGNSNIEYELGENGEFEKTVVEDLIITATAT